MEFEEKKKIQELTMRQALRISAVEALRNELVLSKMLAPVNNDLEDPETALGKVRELKAGLDAHVSFKKKDRIPLFGEGITRTVRDAVVFNGISKLHTALLSYEPKPQIVSLGSAQLRAQLWQSICQTFDTQTAQRHFASWFNMGVRAGVSTTLSLVEGEEHVYPFNRNLAEIGTMATEDTAIEQWGETMLDSVMAYSVVPPRKLSPMTALIVYPL